MGEKRKSFRVKRPLLIRFGLSEGRFQILTLKDISEIGLSFFSESPYSVGKSYIFWLELPNLLDIWQECEGEVLGSEETPAEKKEGKVFRVRMKFTKLPPETSRFLKEYCEFAAKKKN